MSITDELEPIFRPRSIAVIGASHVPGKWGNRMLTNAYRSGFPGPTYPVNPNEQTISGLKAYPSVLDIPGDVDLAVFTVPSAQVPQAMRECVQKGVRAGVVISAGFAEANEEGRRLQDECNEIARAAGFRFVGPNCMGIFSAAGRLNLSFDVGRGGVNPGHIAFISQSGTLGNYLALLASAKGYGLSKFVSTGNQANISFAEYLEYLYDDPDTRAVILYVEGLTEARRFVEVAKQVVRRKPVLVYKAGRTAAGARASLSHTASLAGADEIFDAMCRQVGIIREFEVMHPFDMAEALARQPLPRGNRVTVISGGGGQCVTAADACASMGLDLPEFDIETQGRIRQFLAPHAPAPRNPIDLAATPVGIGSIAEIVAEVPYIDGILVQQPFAGPGRRMTADLGRMLIEGAERIAAIPEKYGKPVITTSMMRFGAPISMDILAAAGIPAYETPEDTARAMAGLAKYAAIRRSLEEE